VLRSCQRFIFRHYDRASGRFRRYGSSASPEFVVSRFACLGPSGSAPISRYDRTDDPTAIFSTVNGKSPKGAVSRSYDGGSCGFAARMLPLVGPPQYSRYRRCFSQRARGCSAVYAFPIPTCERTNCVARRLSRSSDTR
jgi:hypothetical protein